MRVTSKYLELKLVTFNLLHRQPLSHPKEDIQWVIDNWGPDIIGCQEAEGYHSVLKGFPRYGFAWKFNSSGNSGEVPILYNKDTMRLVRTANYRLTWWSQAHVDPSRYLGMAHLVTKTDGVNVFYFNTHANHHIEVGGHPRSSPSTRAATSGFRRMAQIIHEHAKSKDSIVFWGGDLNVSEAADDKVDWKGFPNAIFHAHNMISIYDELHSLPGGRVIDVIGSCSDDPGVKGLHYYTGPQLHSDHRPRSAVYRITRGKSSAGQQPPTPTDTGTDPPDPKVGNPYYPLPDQDFPANIPIPEPADPLAPILEQPVGTWDHSVCCRKNS